MSLVLIDKVVMYAINTQISMVLIQISIIPKISIPMTLIEFPQVLLDLSFDEASARMVNAQNRVGFFQGLQIHVSCKRISFRMLNSPSK